MFAFHIPTMKCGVCSGRVRNAIRHLDADAAIEVSLPNKTVSVQSEAAADEIAAALAEAGYPATVAA